MNNSNDSKTENNKIGIIKKLEQFRASLWVNILKYYYYLKRNSIKDIVSGCRDYCKMNGFKATLIHMLHPNRHKEFISKCFDNYNRISEDERLSEESTVFEKDIKFSIIVPLFNTPEDLLTEMIESVQAQTYKNWELCMADGSDEAHAFVAEQVKSYQESDKRIKYKKLDSNLGISGNTNACLELATGDYIALFDHDDLLHPSALFKYMQVICKDDADFIYCDEDKFEKLGKGFFDAHFKPDFAIDNLRAYNYICHFSVFKKSLLDKVGSFRSEFDGSQDYDMILRLTEQAKRIIHIPEILYHWRVSGSSAALDPYAKPYTVKAAIRAIQEHLERVNLRGSAERSELNSDTYRIKYEITGNPLISILIPNSNHIEELSICIDSIIKKSSYTNYEIIIIENNSENKAFDYYKTLEDNPKIKTVVYKHDADGFNYSAINNFGRKFANGEYLLFLNNDTEVISPAWMEEMLMLCQRKDVGATGAKLLYPDDTIQHAGVILGVTGVAGHAFKNLPKNQPGYFFRAVLQQDLSACTAACLMVKSSVFDEVGGFDEKLAVAFNDIDLCLKMRSKDYLITFTPYAQLYHYESKSRGMDNTFKKTARFTSEIDLFLDRWKGVIDNGDPYYNPNLTLEKEDFSIKPETSDTE